MVLIYIYMDLSVSWPLCVLCVFVCVNMISNQGTSNNHIMCETINGYHVCIAYSVCTQFLSFSTEQWVHTDLHKYFGNCLFCCICKQIPPVFDNALKPMINSDWKIIGAKTEKPKIFCMSFAIFCIFYKSFIVCLNIY